MSETKQIYGAMLAVMGEVGFIGKGKTNTQQNYKFRGIDDVLKELQPLFVKHGVICVPEVLHSERDQLPTKSGGTQFNVRLLVRHTFFAKDGSSIVATTQGEAMDAGDKASNKAMSAALKYALTESFSIPTEESDRDTEEHSPEVGPMQQGTPPANVTKFEKDPIAREVGLILAAAAAARTAADVDALTKRFLALPKPEQERVKPVLSARKAELQASGVKA